MEVWQKLVILICIYVCSAKGIDLISEPQCSKFHYEEQLLEKMIRMGIKMENVEKQILEATTTISEMKRKMDEQYEDDTAARRVKPVVFLAELTKTLTGSKYNVSFDDVKLNLGNAYVAESGQFVAPVDGHYHFALSACSTNGHHIILDFVVNNQALGRLLAGDNIYADCNSKQFMVQLTSGDVVFVQHSYQGDYLYSATDYGRPSFSGFLMAPDYC